MSVKTISSVLSKPTGSFTAAPLNLLQRKCVCGKSGGVAGQCSQCSKKKLTGESLSLIQPKLKISQPNDKYEQEADRVADMVMRMPDPTIQRQVIPEEKEEEESIQTKRMGSTITPLIQRQIENQEEEEEETIQPKLIRNSISPLVQRQMSNEEEDEGKLQLKPLPFIGSLQHKPLAEEEGEEVQGKEGAGQTPTVSPPSHYQINALRGGGQSLPESVRAFYEPRFGANFSTVRIHNSPHATAIARSVNARAFTLGQDVVFGAGQYAPGSSDGRRLLAHELTHVIQQAAPFERQVTAATQPMDNEIATVRRRSRADHIQRKRKRSVKEEEERQAKRVIGFKPILRPWLKKVAKAKPEENSRNVRRADWVIVLEKEDKWNLEKDRQLNFTKIEANTVRERLRELLTPRKFEGNILIHEAEGETKRKGKGKTKRKGKGKTKTPPVFDPCTASLNTLTAGSFRPVSQTVMRGMGAAGRAGAITAVDFPVTQFQQRDVFSVIPDPSAGMVMLDLAQDPGTWPQFCERDRQECERETTGNRFTNRTISSCETDEELAKSAGYVGVNFNHDDCSSPNAGSFFKTCMKFSQLRSSRIVAHEQGHIDAACWMATRANEKLQKIWDSVFKKEKDSGESDADARQAADEARAAAFQQMESIMQGGANEVGLSTGLKNVWDAYDADTTHGCNPSKQEDWTGKTKVFKQLDITLAGINNPFVDIEVPR